MTKQEILDDMILKLAAYSDDWHNESLWQAYKEAWQAWRSVKGDN